MNYELIRSLPLRRRFGRSRPTGQLAKWLPKNVGIVHAEIYPSVREPKPDTIKDRGQVIAMWEWARELDEQNLLWCEFCRPIEIEAGSKEDIAIQLTEGWILGASPTVRTQ